MEQQHPVNETGLCEGILDEARRQGDDLIRRAQAEADDLLAQAKVAADKIRQDALVSAGEEAARRREQLLAAIPVKINRQHALAVEALLQQIHDQARLELEGRQGFDYRSSLLLLAVEAVNRLRGSVREIKLSPADRREFGVGLLHALRSGGDPSLGEAVLAEDPGIKAGVVAEARNGLLCDNQLSSRLARLWPELRRQLAIQSSLADADAPNGGAG